MEARLLRTVSDNGEPQLVGQAGEPAADPLPGLESWQILVQDAAASVDQLRVSSPESDTSKDGKDSLPQTGGSVVECSCIRPWAQSSVRGEVIRFSLYHLTESSGEDGMKGDEDEGFDEEFCDTEEPPQRPLPNLPPLNLQDLNNSDIQTLLAENSFAESAAIVPPFPTTSLLDDIDPGVYMLEAEQSTQSLLETDVGKTSPIHSPFPIAPPSPVYATADTLTLGHTNALDTVPTEWNPYHMFAGNYPSTAVSTESSGFGPGVDMCTPTNFIHPCSPSLSSPSPPPHSGAQCYTMDMFASIPSPVRDPRHAHPAHSPLPVPSYQNHPTADYTMSGGLVNLGSNSPSPSTPPSAVTTMTPTYHHHSYMNPFVNGQSIPVTGCMGGAGPSSIPHGMMTGNNTSSSYSSCSTQTPHRMPPSPAPSSHAPSTSTACPVDNSGISESAPKSKLACSGDSVIHMPFYRFKKILDSSSVPTEKKNDIKNVRRRGKNKIAAKTCRQRKMDLVLGLQQEIESLRNRKMEILGRNNTLQKEIELLKKACRYSAAGHSHHHTQPTT